MAIDNPNSINSDKFYADLNGLQNLKTKARNNSPEALREVAQQFEQIFLSTLLKSMRDANESISPDDNVFSGGNIRFYQDMLDQQTTLEMSQGKGIGLTDVLVRQLSSQLNIPSASQAKSDRLGTEVTAEDLLKRAYNNGANLAASAILGQSDQSKVQGEALRETIDELKHRRAALFQRQDNAKLPDKFDSPAQFVETLLPMAEKVAAQLGVDPKVLLAQAALETGWGKHMVRSADGSNSNNLFNIKAGTRWRGDTAAANTLEFKGGVMMKEVAKFRSYDSYEDSFKDYVQFLKNSPRYAKAVEAAADPHKYLNLLQKAGYATDPRYAEKISSIYDNNLLNSTKNSPNEG